MIRRSAHRIVRNYKDLYRLSKSKSAKQRKAILKQGGMDLSKCICECVLNVIKGNVSLKAGQKKTLHRHRKDLRLLAGKKTVAATKKKILNQRGGFLGAVLGPILASLAGSLFSGLTKQ